MVSVIIPVYNVFPYLREALDSVVNQTCRELEIIIVDDGSTDGSGSVCDAYREDPRVQVIHQKNRGLSNARNVGLDRMKGDYVAFLDPDDAFHPDFIRLMLDAIKREHSDIVACKRSVHHTTDPLRMNSKSTIPPLLEQGQYDRIDALRALIDGKLNMAVWNKLYRTELWKDIRFPDGHNYEDLDTLYRILDQCRSVYMLDQSLYLHRKRPGSITDTHSIENIRDRELACAHLTAFVAAHTPEIFTEKQLKKTRQSRLNNMMAEFATVKSAEKKTNSLEQRNQIISLGKEMGMKNCTFRTRAAYAMVRFCPWLLKISYPINLPIRLLVFRIFGR